VSLTVRFPLPPTANHARIALRGRLVTSAEYRRWLLDAAWEIKAGLGGKPALTGPCVVVLTFPRLRANADLDNRIKPSLDALQTSGVVVNDKQFIDIRAVWGAKDAKFATAQITEVRA
jgi:Holliday junction resolvase RusA-like endonuclease